MKKLLVTLLTVMMFLTSGAAVFAEDVTKTCDVTLTYAETEEFEWSIDVNTVALTSDTLSDEVNVSVTEAALELGNMLKITCDNSVNLQNGDDVITATVTFTDISLAPKDALVDSETATITVTDTFDAASYVVPVGDYTGILTFTASIESAGV